MQRILAHLRSQAVAYVALFVALGGTGYAAVSLPAGSVGNRQLRNHSITPVKFSRNGIGGYVRYWAQISSNGAIVASSPKAHLVGWQTQAPAGLYGGLVGWGRSIPRGCFPLATTVPNGIPPTHFQSYASAMLQGAGTGSGRFVGANVYIATPDTGVNVAVICPQP